MKKIILAAILAASVSATVVLAGSSDVGVGSSVGVGSAGTNVGVDAVKVKAAQDVQAAKAPSKADKVAAFKVDKKKVAAVQGHKAEKADDATPAAQ